jgi:hypothetical protein
MRLELPGKWKRRPKTIESPSATPSLTKPPETTSRASPPILSSASDEGGIEVSRNPTSLDEKGALEDVSKRIRNKSDKQDMKERKRYADNAYGITQAWIGFLMVMTVAQICLKPLSLGLSDAAFIAVFTTTTASVFGFWLLVGNYLFRSK